MLVGPELFAMSLTRSATTRCVAVRAHALRALAMTSIVSTIVLAPQDSSEFPRAIHVRQAASQTKLDYRFAKIAFLARLPLP